MDNRVGPSEAEIRLRLRDDERRATTQIHETSPSAFLVIGLMLEESQRRIRAESKKGEVSLTTIQATDLQEKRISLERRIAGFRSLQSFYMPGVSMLLSKDNENKAGVKIEAEDVTVWLPSALSSVLRQTGCHPDLPAMEENLREGQCRDSLDNIRCLERAKAHFITHRNKNVRGQKRYTRAAILIARMNDKINLAASKYRAARKALLSLRGSGHWERELRELKDQDICSPNSAEFTIEDANDVIGPDGRLKSKKQRDVIEKRLGEGRRLISWIWQAAIGDHEDEGLDDSKLTYLLLVLHY
jgi:hypothetical protein